MDYSVVEERGMFVVGVSGGVDSMFLLNRLVDRFGADRFVVAHVHHGFRSESDEEYEFVKKVCEGYGVLFEGVRLDMPEKMKYSREGLQELSRKYRYDFYKDVCDRYNAGGLILGHHGDDLIETVLMKQVSGSFGRKSIGMVARREDDDFGEVVRPLIRMSKEDVYREALRLGIDWREDPSNSGDSYMRNRFRHSILPALKGERENVHLNYVRYAEEKREEEDYFSRVVSDYLDKSMVVVNGMLKLSRSSFLELDVVIQKRVVLAMTERFEDCVFSRGMVDSLRDVIESNTSGEYVYVASTLWVVCTTDSFYVFDDRVKEDMVDWNACLIKSGDTYMFFGEEVTGNVVKYRYVEKSDRLSNGKRVTKALKELKIPTAFRKSSRVLVVDGDVCAVVSMGSVVLT